MRGEDGPNTSADAADADTDGAESARVDSERVAGSDGADAETPGGGRIRVASLLARGDASEVVVCGDERGQGEVVEAGTGCRLKGEGEGRAEDETLERESKRGEGRTEGSGSWRGGEEQKGR